MAAICGNQQILLAAKVTLFMKMDINERRFVIADVVRITGLDAGTISNWGSRGLANPYGFDETAFEGPRKRGGGLARTYSAKDIMRFVAASELSRLSMSLPAIVSLVGKQIFSDSFNAENPGCYLVKGAEFGLPGANFYPNMAAASKRAELLQMRSPVLIDAAGIFNDVMKKV